MASFAEEGFSGLVRDIRSSLTSEQYDLGGYNEIRARDLIQNAFNKPLPAPTEMVKFSFVVGGGKLVRSRYPDELSKWMVSALREIGYSEDHSAAETFDSQATFKHQHDTGQNLKYIIIYPRVACSAASKGPAAAAAPVQDVSSPAYLVTACKLDTFRDLLASKVTSYSQKKAVLKVLEDSAEAFAAIEAKLVAGAPLTASEQLTYDSNPGCDADKLALLQAALKDMVDQGQLTAKERAALLQQMERNLEALEAELTAARAEAKPKKTEKLEAKKAALLARKAHVSAVAPISPRLRHGEEVVRLYHRLFPLQQLEEKERSLSLTLADLKLLEERPDLLAGIAELQAASRGWFVEDEDHAAMCQQEERIARTSYKPPKPKTAAGVTASKAKPSGSTSSSTSSSSWSTIGVQGAKKSSGAAKGAAPKKAGSGFAAAFADDSD